MKAAMKPSLLWLLIALFAAMLFSACGDESSSDSGRSVSDQPATDDDAENDDEGDDDGNDDADDDDVNDDADDDAVFLECGAQLDGGVILANDLNCEDMNAAAIVLNSGAFLDCAGHEIRGPVGAEKPTVTAQDASDVGLVDCRLVGGQNVIDFRSVSNASVEACEIAQPEMFGVMFNDVDNFTIEDNIISPSVSGSYNGLEIHNARHGVVKGNEIGAFTWSGIALYTVSDAQIDDNIVCDPGDTGIGYFTTGDEAGGCINVTTSGNDVSGAWNVGAVEIMNGSHHLTFSGNNFHDNRQAFYIYDDTGAPSHDIVIAGNNISDNGGGLNIESGTYGVEITENSFSNIDGPLTLRDVEDVTITENIMERETLGTDFPLKFSNATNLEFTHNVLVNYEKYVQASSYDQVDLRENYWDGCPFLIWFDFDDDPLEMINPVNALPCPYVNQGIDIADEDSDGYDDENCEREFMMECVDPPAV